MFNKYYLYYTSVGPLSKMENWNFLIFNFIYFQHIIWQGQIDVFSFTIDKTHDHCVKTNVKEQLSSGGLCKAFWKLVPNFVRIAQHLKSKICSGEPRRCGNLNWNWAIALPTALEKLMSPCIIAFLYEDGKYTVDAEVWDQHTEWLSLQVLSKRYNQYPGYGTKLLTLTEAAFYKSCEFLCCAQIKRRLWPYLQSLYITICTDDNA